MAEGPYTEITALIYPAEARRGDVPLLYLFVKNIWSASLSLRAEGWYERVDAPGEPVEVSCPLEWVRVNPGDIVRFSCTLIMPNGDIRGSMWSVVHHALYGSYYDVSEQFFINLPGTLPPTLVSISVTPSGISIERGKTQQFTATGAYSDGSTRDITSEVTWTSSNMAVVTISAAGLATAKAAGVTAIKAMLGDIGYLTMITVTEPEVTEYDFAIAQPTVSAV